MSEQRTVTRFISIDRDFQIIQVVLNTLSTQSQEIQTLFKTLESWKGIIDSGIQSYVSHGARGISKTQNAIIDDNLAQQYKNASNALRTKLSLTLFADGRDLNDAPIPPPPSPVTSPIDFPFLETTTSGLVDISTPKNPPSSVSFFGEYCQQGEMTSVESEPETATPISASRCDVVLRFLSSLWMVGGFMALAVISILAVYATQKESATTFIKDTPSTESAKEFFNTALTVYLSAFTAVIIMAVTAFYLRSQKKELAPNLTVEAIELNN